MSSNGRIKIPIFFLEPEMEVPLEEEQCLWNIVGSAF